MTLNFLQQYKWVELEKVCEIDNSGGECIQFSIRNQPKNGEFPEYYIYQSEETPYNHSTI